MVLSITDAAYELDVTRQRVHAMLKGGKLKGNTWVVCRESVVRRKLSRESC